MLLLFMITLVTSVEPFLLCPRAASPTYFSYPELLDCNATDTYQHGFLNLYIPNIQVREVKVVVLWKETITCQTSYFFFGSYKEKIETHIIPMRMSEAQQNYEDNFCTDIKFTKNDIKCEYSWPHEKTVSIERCVKMRGELIVSKGEIMSSTVGDTSHCSLRSKHCLLSNDKHIFWNNDGDELTTYKKPVNHSYVTVGDRYLINKLSISLKLLKEEKYEGKNVWSTNEGFLVEIITSIRVTSSNWDRFDYRADIRNKRDIETERGELEGKIQYLFDYVYSFLGKTPMMCLVVNLHARIMKQQAQLLPTIYARAALQSKKIIAHATEHYLIVSPCIDIQGINNPYYNINTSSIQVDIKIKNNSEVYNVDTRTNEITKHIQQRIHEWELPIIMEVNGDTMKVFKDKTVKVDFTNYVHQIPIFRNDNILLPHLDLDDAWVYTKEDLSDKAYWNFINSYQDTQETLHYHDTTSHDASYEDQSKFDLKIPFLSNLTYLGSLLDLIRTIATIGGILYVTKIVRETTIYNKLMELISTYKRDTTIGHHGHPLGKDDGWPEGTVTSTNLQPLLNRSLNEESHF